MNAEGTRVANAWDLAKDDAAGLQCKAFGVGGIIRQPGRLHITWQDDNTLKMEFDAGTQTRLLNFDRTKQATGEKTWQGHSHRTMGEAAGRRTRRRCWCAHSLATARDRLRQGAAAEDSVEVPLCASSLNQGGSLKVVTTNFREGYLRKNGVPYSENATITEYFHRLPSEPGEDTWLLVITVIEDPKYLNQPFYTSTQFKLEAGRIEVGADALQDRAPAEVEKDHPLAVRAIAR